MSTAGVISGTPGNAGTTSVSVTVTDLSGHQVTVSLSLAIEPVFSVGSASNWSGYVEQNGPFHGVSATFNVASLTNNQPAICNTGTYDTLSQYCSMAEWVGIDSYNNSDLIQAGINEQPLVGTGQFYISPWWEILPQYQYEVSISSIVASIGDSIAVEIYETTTVNFWEIYVVDNTNGESFSTQQYYYGPGTSAEWIVEATQINGVYATLSPYTSVTFTNPTYSLAPSGGVD